ncbi:integrase domain-containing protein [Pseudodesulfovibrio thermohalotolerans]|uniref:integrase domain-containing protein n=1 Tax=Pseudodesulfovibrio thermohalotolerans TaxID=2880651 RepID=UPI0024424A55|nr:integrase domain-containing protein [Pseudodesulfovibrio thermohalotolerans]WFS61871.1 integrase domain-containing protein [Pseudodesulfovibrio thermohalotolerans]
MTKSISLVLGANRATLSGSRSKQHRVRQNARAFAKRLRREGFGVRKWTNVTNKHFAAVARQMQEEGKGDGRIAEIFSAARDLCKAYGNTGISPTNDAFDVRRGSIANANSKAVAPAFVQGAIDKLENEFGYEYGPRCAAQIRLQWELGLRREESAKVDLVTDWDREGRSLLVQYGTKGGRPRTLTNLSDKQQEALERALPYTSQSNRPGVHNLMPEGMGDKWQEKLSYAARLCGFTKKESGWTLHSNRHERFHRLYVEHTGFQPPNQHPSVKVFQQTAYDVAGDEWPRLDAEARDEIEVTAGHSAGRRDVSDAYLGSSQ